MCVESTPPPLAAIERLPLDGDETTFGYPAVVTTNG
jgi:hypothetical protein